jgi:hypothetical protein
MGKHVHVIVNSILSRLNPDPLKPVESPLPSAPRFGDGDCRSATFDCGHFMPQDWAWRFCDAPTGRHDGIPLAQGPSWSSPHGPSVVADPIGEAWRCRFSLNRCADIRSALGDRPSRRGASSWLFGRAKRVSTSALLPVGSWLGEQPGRAPVYGLRLGWKRLLRWATASGLIYRFELHMRTTH